MVENLMFISEIVMAHVRSSSLGLFVPRNYYYCYRISHFSDLAGKYSPILGCSNQQD